MKRKYGPYADDNVYRKRANGRYEAFGVMQPINYLPDGIWYVKHRDGCYQTANADKYIGGLFRMGDIKQPDIDLDIKCGLYDYVGKILDSKEFRDLYTKGYSLQDIVVTTIKILYELNQNKFHEKQDNQPVNHPF